MPKKKSSAGKQTDIKVGNISAISGVVNIAGGNLTMHQTTTGLSAAEIQQLFNRIYNAIEANARTSPANKEDIKAEVQEIQFSLTAAAQKNEKVDESFLARRFRNIARIAPDVLEVVVATLGNPLAGLGVAVHKIADRAKGDTSSSAK